jgi:hypothetical protein
VLEDPQDKLDRVDRKVKLDRKAQILLYPVHKAKLAHRDRKDRKAQILLYPVHKAKSVHKARKVKLVRKDPEAKLAL